MKHRFTKSDIKKILAQYYAPEQIGARCRVSNLKKKGGRK